MKKTILKITAAAAFALLMAFNVTTTINSTNFSFSGLKALASGTTTECTSFGHKNWDHPFSARDGYDCLCKERDDVKNSCE